MSTLFFLSLVVMNGIRGAIATVENTENDILKSTKELFNTIVENNNLDISKIVSVIFTVTNDLDAAFPAKALRELGHHQLSAIDTKAPNVVNDLEGCIRVLVTYKDEIEVTHTYLGEAKNLRPDR